MMAESLESRKFERKPLFDVPLPVRGKNKEASAGGETGEAPAPVPSSTMAFSLLTKKGNRQQVRATPPIFLCVSLTFHQTRTVELPSDSTFAVAMKNQQQAEREEQQRIKNLVLNYDLRENDDQDGNHNETTLHSNPNIHNVRAGHDKPTSYHHNRSDRGKDRGGQRVRKLQLSDVDWYESSAKRGNSFAQTHSSCSNAVTDRDEKEQSKASLTHHLHSVVDKRGKPAMG